MRILLVDAQSEALTVIARWLDELVKARPNPPPVVVLASGRAGGVDLWLEKRHLQASLLDFLQRRFPEIWAKSVAERETACAR